jgi:hypothetical protein
MKLGEDGETMMVDTITVQSWKYIGRLLLLCFAGIWRRSLGNLIN